MFNNSSKKITHIEEELKKFKEEIYQTLKSVSKANTCLRYRLIGSSSIFKKLDNTFAIISENTTKKINILSLDIDDFTIKVEHDYLLRNNKNIPTNEYCGVFFFVKIYKNEELWLKLKVLPRSIKQIYINKKCCLKTSEVISIIDKFLEANNYDNKVINDIDLDELNRHYF